MNGYGEFIWKEGKKYFGYYKKDKKNGFGVFYWPNEKFFCGFWKDGKQNGIGKYSKGNIVKYGVWKHGKKELWFEDENEFERNLDEREKKFLGIMKFDIWDVKKFMNIK